MVLDMNLLTILMAPKQIVVGGQSGASSQGSGAAQPSMPPEEPSGNLLESNTENPGPKNKGKSATAKRRAAAKAKAKATLQELADLKKGRGGGGDGGSGGGGKGKGGAKATGKGKGPLSPRTSDQERPPHLMASESALATQMARATVNRESSAARAFGTSAQSRAAMGPIAGSTAGNANSDKHLSPLPCIKPLPLPL